MSNIGFIGLGNMGGPMAANLVKSGEHVLGFDLVPASREAAAKDGVQIVGNAQATRSRTPTSSSPCCQPASMCCRSGTTSLPLARQGTLVHRLLDHRRDSARKAHALAAARGIATLDAPVSGGVGGAKAATLTFMVGGSTHAFERGKPVLERMGKRIVHCGDAGNGQVAKMCNNMILGASMIVVSEAFVLGEKLGLSHQAMFDVVSASSGQCWSLTSYCPVPGPVPASPANNGYKAGLHGGLDAEGSETCKSRRGIRSRPTRRSARMPRKFTSSSPTSTTARRISPRSSISCASPRAADALPTATADQCVGCASRGTVPDTATLASASSREWPAFISLPR